MKHNNGGIYAIVVTVKIEKIKNVCRIFISE